MRSLWAADLKEDDREATSNNYGEKNFDADEDHSENGLMEEHRTDRMIEVMTEIIEGLQNMDKENQPNVAMDVKLEQTLTPGTYIKYCIEREIQIK